MKYEFALR